MHSINKTHNLAKSENEYVKLNVLVPQYSKIFNLKIEVIMNQRHLLNFFTSDFNHFILVFFAAINNHSSQILFLAFDF